MLFNILLASLPLTQGAAALQYSPPAALVAQVSADDRCGFPANYEVHNFAGQSNGTVPTLHSFDFEYEDVDTDVTTFCHFNSSSETTSPSAPRHRFPCDNRAVEFIWENDLQKLWLVEGVCPGADGAADYEASGSLLLPLNCGTSGGCSPNSTSHSAKFTNISPVRPYP